MRERDGIQSFLAAVRRRLLLRAGLTAAGYGAAALGVGLLACASTPSRGGTVCDSCADAAWAVTVGDIGGADPELVHESDLIVSWSSDLHATNVHTWAAIEKRRAAGVKLVVIDPRRTRSARVADCFAGAYRHRFRVGVGRDAHPGA